MSKVVYPAVVYKEEEEGYVVLLPDLDIAVDGDIVEKAYLDAENKLQQYMDMSIKFECDIPEPTQYEQMFKMNPKKNVLLSNAEVKKDLKMSEDDKKYKNFMTKYFKNVEE